MKTISLLLLIMLIPNLVVADTIYLRPKGKLRCKIIDMAEDEIIYRVKNNRGKYDTLGVSYDKTLALKYKGESLLIITSETEADSLRVIKLTKEKKKKDFNPFEFLVILMAACFIISFAKTGEVPLI